MLVVSINWLGMGLIVVWFYNLFYEFKVVGCMMILLKYVIV